MLFWYFLCLQYFSSKFRIHLHYLRVFRVLSTRSKVISTSAVFTVSSLFSQSLDLRLCLLSVLSTFFCWRFTNRWSMIIGGSFYVIVVASNLVSNSVVQIITNCIVGVGAAMIWNAQGVYLGRCALRDSRTSTKSMHFSSLSSRFRRDYFFFQRCFLLHLPVLWYGWYFNRWYHHSTLF